MYGTWNFSDNLFTQGHKSLTRGLVLFGAFLVALAVMIFLFPALIGFIFAAFILLAVLFALFTGYKIWKLRDRIQTGEWMEEPVVTTYRSVSPRGYYRRTVFIVK